jgi:hypothetical protein
VDNAELGTLDYGNGAHGSAVHGRRSRPPAGRRQSVRGAGGYAARDTIAERDAYLALGVREVWFVEMRDRSIEVCTQPGEGRLVRDAVTWSMPDGDASVRVELAELFEGIV